MAFPENHVPQKFCPRGRYSTWEFMDCCTGPDQSNLVLMFTMRFKKKMWNNFQTSHSFRRSHFGTLLLSAVAVLLHCRGLYPSLTMLSARHCHHCCFARGGSVLELVGYWFYGTQGKLLIASHTSHHWNPSATKTLPWKLNIFQV